MEQSWIRVVCAGREVLPTKEKKGLTAYIPRNAEDFVIEIYPPAKSKVLEIMDFRLDGLPVEPIGSNGKFHQLKCRDITRITHAAPAGGALIPLRFRHTANGMDTLAPSRIKVTLGVYYSIGGNRRSRRGGQPAPPQDELQYELRFAYA